MRRDLDISNRIHKIICMLRNVSQTSILISIIIISLTGA